MITFFLILNLSIFAYSSNMPDSETLLISKSSDFIFDSPDVVKEYAREDGTRVRLDAYRTKNNGLLTAEQFSGFRWVSISKTEISK